MPLCGTSATDCYGLAGAPLPRLGTLLPRRVCCLQSWGILGGADLVAWARLQVLAEARMQGTLLPAWHPATVAVKRVGMRVAQVRTRQEAAPRVRGPCAELSPGALRCPGHPASRRRICSAHGRHCAAPRPAHGRLLPCCSAVPPAHGNHAEGGNPPNSPPPPLPHTHHPPNPPPRLLPQAATDGYGGGFQRHLRDLK